MEEQGWSLGEPVELTMRWWGRQREQGTEGRRII